MDKRPKKVIETFTINQEPCHLFQVLYTLSDCYFEAGKFNECNTCSAHYWNIRLDYSTLVTGDWLLGRRGVVQHV